MKHMGGCIQPLQLRLKYRSSINFFWRIYSTRPTLMLLPESQYLAPRWTDDQPERAAKEQREVHLRKYDMCVYPMTADGRLDDIGHWCKGAVRS